MDDQDAADHTHPRRGHVKNPCGGHWKWRALLILFAAAFPFAGASAYPASAEPHSGLPPSAAPQASIPSQLPAAIYTKPQTLVPIAPGLRLNLYCLGKGAPAVLLEAGLGGDMLSWRNVQGQISQFTEVCAYDRAGHGFSDATQQPADLNGVTANLQKLIQAAKIKTQIVLVGHSIGGEFATMFAAEHPAEMAGLVLVDPAFAHQETLLTTSLPKARQNFVLALDQDTIVQLRGCIAAIQAKQNDASKMIPAICLDDPPNPDPALHQVLNQQRSSIALNAAMLSELTANTQPSPTTLSVDDLEIDHAMLDFGSMPLIVFTAGDQRVGATRAEIKAVYAAWLAGHQALARRSKNGWSIEVAKTDHFIQDGQPSAVIDAVRSIVFEVRENGG